MRLLVVSSWFPYPPDNGSRLRAFHVLTQLSRRHTLTLLSFGRPGGHEEAEPLLGICDRVTVVDRPESHGSHLATRGLLSSTPRHLVQTGSARMRALVTQCLEHHDLVLALQLDAAFHVTGATKVRPTVFDEVEVGAALGHYRLAPDLATRLRRGLTWWKFRRFARSLIADFNRTTVVSDVERQLVAALGCDMTRVVVVPNGVDLRPFAPAESRARRLVYPGAVTYSANLDAVRYFAGEVLPLVRSEEPDVAFWITGSTEGVDVAGLGRVDGVTFTGRLPDVTQTVAQSLACVVPLRHGGGTRLKVLEAMALGTPVISTSKGIEGLDVEPGVHVLVANEPNDFANQTLRVMRDPALASRLTLAARRRVEDQYGWNAIGEALDAVLADAVSVHPRGA